MAGTVAVLWLAIASPALAGDTILTSLPPVFSLAATLAKGTDIDVKEAPARFPGMNNLQRVLTKADASLNSLLKSATAVISIESVWPGDPLYRQARSRNIRIVPIDAARSMDLSGASVAVINQPTSSLPRRTGGPTGSVSPYVWFSPSNAIKMADIIAADLMRLSPSNIAKIRANLSEFTSGMQTLRAEYDARILRFADTRLFALSDHFVYLTNEFAFDVEGYFLEDDVRWTAADLKGFSEVLKEHDIRVVIHHWEPAEPIRRAITEGGAKLVVLRDVDGASDTPSDPQSYESILRANLEAICSAMSE
jgi:ABC-type Zn uptake system ZnuABC Zn-binding protein ZnuA